MFAWQLSKRTFAIHCFRLSGINFYHSFTFRFPSLISYLKWFALNFCLVCKRNCCWELYFRFRFISFLEHKPRNLTKFSERAACGATNGHKFVGVTPKMLLSISSLLSKRSRMQLYVFQCKPNCKNSIVRSIHWSSCQVQFLQPQIPIKSHNCRRYFYDVNTSTAIILCVHCFNSMDPT